MNNNGIIKITSKSIATTNYLFSNPADLAKEVTNLMVENEDMNVISVTKTDDTFNIQVRWGSNIAEFVKNYEFHLDNIPPLDYNNLVINMFMNEANELIFKTLQKHPSKFDVENDAVHANEPNYIEVHTRNCVVVWNDLLVALCHMIDNATSII